VDAKGGLPLLRQETSRRGATGGALLDNRTRGVARDARERGEVVSEPFAPAWDGTGGTVTLATPAGPRAFRVAGVYRDYSNDRGTVVLDRALYLKIFDDPEAIFQEGWFFCDVGEHLRGLDYLQRAVARGYFPAVTLTEWPQFDALRDDPVFQTLLADAEAGRQRARAASRRGAARVRPAARDGRVGEPDPMGPLLEAFLTGATGTVAAGRAAFAWLLLLVINPQSFGWTVALDVPGATRGRRRAHPCGLGVRTGIVPGRIASAVDPAAALGRMMRRDAPDSARLAGLLLVAATPSPPSNSPRSRVASGGDARVVVLDGSSPGRRRHPTVSS
jgi:putative ABC transport system permease protein